MAHGLFGARGSPPRPIYPTACMYTVGRLRSLHADCRPVGTTRPNWGRPSGLWRPSNGQPAWHLAPMLCPGLGSTRGGGGPGPQGCTRCPTGAAWFREVWPAYPSSSSSSSCIHSSPQPPNPPIAPSSSFSSQFGPTISGLGHAYSCPLSSPARRRQPADLVTAHLGRYLPAHAFSQSCFWSSFQVSSPPPWSQSLLFTKHPPLPLTCLLNEQHQSITGHPSCCIYVIEPAGHQVSCSHLLGGVLSEIVSCIIDLLLFPVLLLPPTSPGSLEQRTMVGGVIRLFLIPFNVRHRPKPMRQKSPCACGKGFGGAGYDIRNMEITVLSFRYSVL